VNPTPLLELRSVTVQRGGREVVREVGFRVEPSERVALVGPNAAGKSTLLSAIAGLLAPSRGEILFSGSAIVERPPREVARNIALVVSVQEGATRLSVAQSTDLGRYPHTGPLSAFGERDVAAVDEAIAETGLGGLRDRSLNSLSAGERQRAVIARALAQEPRLLLLDEPSAHLDIGHALDLFDLLTTIAARGVAIIAVIHDLPSAARWATRMIVMHEGAVIDDGEPARVMRGDALGKAFGVVTSEARTDRPDGAATWRFDRPARSAR